MQLIIEIKEGDKDSPKKKTRQFAATCLGYLNTPLLWDGGYHKTETRPSYIVVAGTRASLSPFLANFHTKGLRADLLPPNGRSSWSKDRNWFRCLKSANFAVATQQDGTNGQIATVYQPNIFQVDPGMIDPHFVKFISIPPQQWCNEQVEQLSHNDKTAVIKHIHKLNLFSEEESILGFVSPFRTEEEVIQLIPQAVHFGHCFDKRIKRPLIASIPFYVHIYLSALANGLASYWHGHPWQWAVHKWASDFSQSNAFNLGFTSGAIVKSDHKAVDTFLEKEVARFLTLK